MGPAQSVPELHRFSDVERSVVVGKLERAAAAEERSERVQQAELSAAHRLHPGGRSGLQGCRVPRIRDQDPDPGPAGSAGGQTGELLRAAALQPVQEPAHDRQVRDRSPKSASLTAEKYQLKGL